MDIQEDTEAEIEDMKKDKSRSSSSDDTPPTFGLAGPSTFNVRTGGNIVNGTYCHMHICTCTLYHYQSYIISSPFTTT